MKTARCAWNGLVLLALTAAAALADPAAPAAPPDQAGGPTRPHFIELNCVRATYARNVLEQLAESDGSAPKLLRVAADDHANVLILMGGPDAMHAAESVVKRIDVPAERREELMVFPIRHTMASRVKAVLDELAVPDAASSSCRPSIESPPGTIREGEAGTNRAPGAAAAREPRPDSILSGTVSVAADDRLNLLLILSRPENRPFFEKLIKTVDAEKDAAGGAGR